MFKLLIKIYTKNAHAKHPSRTYVYTQKLPKQNPRKRFSALSVEVLTLHFASNCWKTLVNRQKLTGCVNKNR